MTIKRFNCAVSLLLGTAFMLIKLFCYHSQFEQRVNYRNGQKGKHAACTKRKHAFYNFT